MSIESAKAFFEKVQTDESFKNKITGIGSSEERIKFIKDEGFDFTEEEFHQVRGELTPEALDKATGGAHCGFSHEGECRILGCRFHCSAQK